MTKAITTASWIGKAAYELINSKGLSGRVANARARRLADGLLYVGIDLTHIDPRDYVHDEYGTETPGDRLFMSPQPTERQQRQSTFLNGC
jgi:hypothetical protein